MNKYYIALLLFISFTIIYYLGSFSKIPFGDSIGFVLETEKMEFIPSSTTHTHFLFINTLIFLKKIAPDIESVEIGRFLTIISASLSLSVLYNIIFKIINNHFYSIIGTIIFGFSFSFWRNTEGLEVYTYNLLFVSLFIWFCIKFLIDGNTKNLIYSALFLGLGCWVHIQDILMIPSFLFLVYKSKNLKIKILSSLVLGTLFFGLFILAIANKHPLTSIFSSGTIAQHIELKSILKNVFVGIGYLIYNFWYFIIFFIIGLIKIYKYNLNLFIFLSLASLPIFGFAGVFAVSDNYVYFIPFNFIVTIFIAFGFYSLSLKKYVKTLSYSCILIPLFYLLSFKIAFHTPQGLKLNETKNYKGGLNYYLLPWMNNNVGILEFTIDNRKSPDRMEWMTKAAKELIMIKSKYQSPEEIRKL
ncbi:protein O-mannosyl-transferase family [Chryseobacterium oryctis]|uniref:DUF2723 domain-containing protein n=1 Tax=Chryseobacterium oryctis TaxID=2952618 RepID=A0ABT3HKH1_9FLAO|nr:DUF2723 domain-containing protein [Chryseobacterium oryctis]MCW3160256.1 DUF2723 domain-containing protein [Chryseobacterium oryctis]